MHDALTTAIEMHRSGQLGQASELYQKILAGEQEIPEALHLLGVLNHRSSPAILKSMEQVNYVWPGGRSSRFLAYCAAPIRRANASLGSMDRPSSTWRSFISKT